ncbi:hypothetical protein SCORR_v1c06960 [Spiroplasma corruscae]|uniref:Lipoprotein n=1 Tax=Spiroplasma corruscae TaxID=216934 RepID=A0A222EPK7_9MOLU|nr:hypothetical protein [Spiroplasma corruscae]ASP28468.1 hypothetical protein SCORR_v1c06960 [Spiroplasma corruscae]
MKKLIKILVSLTFLSTPVTTVVSCGNKNNGQDEPIKDLTDLQNQMKSGAEMMSKLIIASKHENLNYNLNEILSMYLTPTPTALKMPVTYKYNDNDINFSTSLNKYKSLLAPSLEKINNDNYSGVFASYVMGMYDDNFYTNIAQKGNFEDSFNTTGGTGFNKSSDNELGILAGFNKNYKLSSDENRRNLAWGIQDTGALTNYLLDKGYDGAFPGDTNGTSSPKSASSDSKGGTNGSGYLYYNSIVSNGKGAYNANKIKNNKVISKLPEDLNYKSRNTKDSEDKYSSEVNGMKFNKIGSLLSNTAGEQNINGYINNISSLKSSITESDFGSESLLNFINFMTPILTKKANQTELIMQYVAYGLIYNAMDVINGIQKNSDMKDYLISKGFDQNIFDKLINVRKPLNDALDLLSPDTNKISITSIYNNNDDDTNKDQLDNLQNVSSFLKQLQVVQNKLNTDEEKLEFTNKVFLDKNNTFYNSYKIIIDGLSFFSFSINGMGLDAWKNVIGKNGDGGVNLLSLISNVYNKLANNDTKELLSTLKNQYKDIGLADLSRTQKLKLIKSLGYDSTNKKYTEDSYMYNAYNLITNQSIDGVKELDNLFSVLKDAVNGAMKEVHENALQYIYDEKYWKTSNVKVTSTDPSELNAKMEFTLEYNGVGDADSNADQQTKKVDVPENFNPYQTILKYQESYLSNDDLKSKVDTTKTSGEVLGKKQYNLTDDDLIKYDGKGENYKTVNHKYNLVWQNISNDVNNPHWVVVDIKSYNNENKEFYNLY